MTVASAPPQAWAEAPPLTPAAFLALRELVHPHELAYRRARLKGATRFFGLDLHREYVVAYAVDETLNTVVKPTTLPWDRFPAWCAKTLTKTDAVAIEMTTNTWATHDELIAYCHSVTVVHPQHLKVITSVPVMTDKKACEALATFLAAGLLRGVWVPEHQFREWRRLVAQRQDCVVRMAIAKNRLHSLLFSKQIAKPKAADPFRPSLRDWWLALPGTPVEKLTVELLLAQIDHDKAQITRLELIIAQELMTDERAPFLLQISGVGVLGAMKILAAIGTMERFPTPDHLVGYAGLGGRVHASGQRTVQGGITKAGRQDLRSAMVVAARHARNVNKHWKEVYRQLEPRLGPNKAVVAVARRMLVSVWHILTKRQPDRYADWGKVATGFMTLAYDDFGGAAHIPGGRTAPEFVRWCLDTLGVGEKLQRVKFSGKTYILPRSTLPGAAPEAEPIGRGRRQNTKATQAKRLAEADAKREALAAKQAAAEARRGKPRKTRSDKGTKRGPQKKK
ncbi:MAG: IS110 family transposase [Anaerolineales bacterium]|nr:IS110 family transposase [Anaerolineales bacterium]